MYECVRTRLDLVERVVGIGVGHQGLPNDEQHGEQKEEFVSTTIDTLLVCFLVVACICVHVRGGWLLGLFQGRHSDGCCRQSCRGWTHSKQQHTTTKKQHQPRGFTEKGIDCLHLHASFLCYRCGVRQICSWKIGSRSFSCCVVTTARKLLCLVAFRFMVVLLSLLFHHGDPARELT